MDQDERKVLKLLGSAWDQFIALPEMHPADQPEFMFHIHQAQNIVMARATLRAMRNANQEDLRPTWIKEGE